MMKLTEEDMRLIADVARYGIVEAARQRQRHPQTIKNKMSVIHKRTETSRLAELVWYAFVEPYRGLPDSYDFTE